MNRTWDTIRVHVVHCRRWCADAVRVARTLIISLPIILQPVASAFAAVEKWQPHVDVTVRSSDLRSTGKLDFFVPLRQDNDSLLFLDLRAVSSDDSTGEGNFGLGYRRITARSADGSGDRAWGVYGFFDRKRSENDNYYSQGTFGAEWLGGNFELRANGYLADDDTRVIARRQQPGVSSTTLSGTQLVQLSQDAIDITAREAALSGYDLEAGYRFDLGKERELWAYGGYFRFDHDDTPTVDGSRLRLEYRHQEPFGWRGSQLTLGTEFQHDDIRGAESIAQIQLRVPFGAKTQRPRLKGIDRRLAQQIVRDIDVVTFAEDINKPVGSEGGPTGTGGSGGTTTTPVTDSTGGQVNVYFVQQGGTGNCTQAAPCDLAAASGDTQFAAGDAVVLLDAGGTIVGNITLQERQQLAGAGASGSRTLTLGDVSAQLNLSGLGGRAQLDGGAGTAVTLASGAQLSGFDISGGATGIGISSASDGANISDLNISGTTVGVGAGAGGSGTITFQNSVAINSGAGTGLQLAGGSGTFNFAGGITGGAGAAFAATGGSNTLNYTGSLVNDSGRLIDISGGANSMIFSGMTSANGGTGIAIANSSGSLDFNSAVNITGASTDAVSLTNNAGATISFNGGLAIDASGGVAFSATGGGTVNIANAGTRTITQSGGTGALALDGVTIGAAGINFAAITTTGATSGTSVSINNVGGGAFAGGNVTLAGTTVASAADGINITGSAASFSFADVVIDNTDDEGIALSGANGDVVFTSVDIDGTAGRGVEIVGATNAVTINGGAIGLSTPSTGFATRIENQAAGSVIAFNNVDITGNFSDTLNLSNSDGTVNVSGGTLTQVGSNDTVDIDGGAGTVNITSALVHTGSGGAANAVEIDGTSGAITLSGNVTNTGGGRLIDIGALTNIAGGSVQLSGVLTDTNGDGVRIQNVDAGAGITVAGPTITSASGTGIEIGANAGTVAFTGTTAVSGSGGTSIDLSAATGTITFGDVDITNLGGVTGVSTAGASGAVTMASLDITGTGAASSVGVDITGSTGSLTVTNAGTIQNVITGFELDSLGTGTTNASLSYQNGTINAGVPVNTVGIAAGSYNFTGSTITKDNALSTATGFGGDFLFVDATGGGTGTSVNRASADFAETNSNAGDIIVLVNDGTGNIVATNGLQLQNDQQLIGFAAGNATVDFTGNNAQVLGSFQYDINDPTSNGAATLTNSGGTEVVTLADNAKVRDFSLTTSGAVDGIAGSGFTGATINNIAIANAGAEAFDFTNAAGTITITDSSATNSTGAGLRINGGNATVALNNFDVSDTGFGRSLEITATTGGSVSFDAASSISNSGGTGVLINNIGGDVTFNGAVSVTNATSTAITATNLNTNTVAFSGGLGTVSTTAGTALSASDGTLNIAGTTTINATGAQALAFNSLTVGDGGGGALAFDTVTSGGGANGIALTNVTATNGLTITDATLSGNTTAGININGVSGSLNIAAADIDGAATGVAIAGANGTVNVGTGSTGLDIDGGTTGVSINQTSGTVNLGTGGTGLFAVDGTSGVGVTLAGAGTVNIGTGGGSSTIGATSDTGGTAFAVTGGTVSADYAGSIALASNVGLVSVSNHAVGTLTFGGALTNSAATTATQLDFNNADGTYNFDGAVNVNTTGGTGIGIDVTATSGGTIDFDNTLIIAAASGNAIQMDGTGSLDVSGGSLDIDTTSGGGLFQSAGTVSLSDATSIRAATSGTGINATGGTLAVASGAGTAEVISTSGQGLLLSGVTTGTGGVSFDTVTSGGGANGISLTNVTAANGLTITNAMLAGNTTAGLNVNGVTGTLNIAAANIDTAAAGTGVAIAGANGTLTIGNGGTGLDIDGGTTGVSINQSSGTVNLGTGASGVFAVDNTSGVGVTLAGVGTVNIGTGGMASIGATSDTGGTAFAVTGGTVNANYAGSIDLASNVGLVSVQGGHDGTLTFSGALSSSAATTATQLDFNNADGTYNFDGTVSANTTGGTGVGIDVAATSGGTIDFDNTLTLATASGNAIQMDGTGSLDVSGGSLNVDTTSGTGLSQSAGTVTLSDTTSIAATTGTGINGTGGTLAVASGAGTAEVISTGGQGLLLSGVTLGATFDNVTSGGGANNVTLTNTSGTLAINGGALSGSGATAFDVNGGTSVISYGGSITNTAGRSVQVQNRSGGSVTLAGNIADTGTGINIATNTGGTVTFSGASQAINTGASAAVTLASNTGATINFSGGGLDIDTTSGAGFNATGGGTVNVTGANNTITSTTGTALNVANTTIGASDLTFRSISVNGAVNGIVLNNTGSSGGLTVTGVGTTGGSGGTLQNTTGAAISLTNTSSFSLSNSNITNAAAAGILGNNVSDLTFDNVAINDAATSGDAISLTNATGTVSLLNSAITYDAVGADGLDINNSALGAGTLTLVVDNTSFTGDTTASGLLNAINVVTSAGSTLNATITSSSFTNTFLTGQLIDINGTGGGDSVTIGTSGNGNTYTGVGSDQVNLMASDNSSVTFDIRDNIINGNSLSADHGINIAIDDGVMATVNIIDNMLTDIGTDAANSAIRIAAGFAVTANSRLDLTATGNTLSNNAATGLLLGVFGDSDANVVVNNNTFDTNGNNEGIRVITADNATQACLAAASNTFVGDQITLTETADGSILRVPGVSAAGLSAANGGVTVNDTNANVGFNDACTIP